MVGFDGGLEQRWILRVHVLTRVSGNLRSAFLFQAGVVGVPDPNSMDLKLDMSYPSANSSCVTM